MNGNRKVWWMGWVLAASLSLGACGGGDDDGDAAPPPADDTPPPALVGTVTELPSGVSLRGEVNSNTDSTPGPDTFDADTLVPLSLTFSNDSDQEKTIIIPACFAFLSSDKGYQDGLNVQKRLIVLAAHSVRTVVLGTYCLQKERDAPTSGIVYTRDKVTTEAELLRICEILAEKRPVSAAEDKYRLQLVIWNVTDGEGLTQDDITWLNALRPV